MGSSSGASKSKKPSKALSAQISKRHIQDKRTKLDPDLKGLSYPAAKRISQRGGVLRQGKNITPAMRESMKKTLTQTLGYAVVFMEHDGRRMMQDKDIKAAFANQNISVYGAAKPPKKTKAAKDKAAAKSKSE